MPAASFTTYKIGEPYAAFSVIWTEVRVKTGRYRVFTLCFTSVVSPWQRLPSNPRITVRLACGSAALGDGRGDGKRAVATPLFDGQSRSQCPSGSARLRLAPGSPPPVSRPLHQIFEYYTSNTARTLEAENSVLPR